MVLVIVLTVLMSPLTAQKVMAIESVKFNVMVCDNYCYCQNAWNLGN